MAEFDAANKANFGIMCLLFHMPDNEDEVRTSPTQSDFVQMDMWTVLGFHVTIIGGS